MVWGAMRKRALCGDDDSNDEAVDAENTGHDDGNDGLHNELRPHDTHGGNSNAGLGSAIRGAHACEGGIRKSSCSINTCKPSKLSLGEDQRGPAGQRERAERGVVGRTAEDEGGRGAEEAEEGAHLVAGEVAASKARPRALGEGGEGHKSPKACLHRAHFPLLLSTRLRPLAPCLNAYSDDQGATPVLQPFFRCCPPGS